MLCNTVRMWQTAAAPFPTQANTAWVDAGMLHLRGPGKARYLEAYEALESSKPFMAPYLPGISC